MRNLDKLRTICRKGQTTVTHLSAFAYKAERQTKKANLNTHLAQLYYLQIRIQTEPQAEIELGAVAVAVADNPSANQFESQCALYGRSLSPGHVCQLCLVCLVCQSLSQSGNSSVSLSGCLSVHLCPGNPSVVVVVFMASHRRNCGQLKVLPRLGLRCVFLAK